MKGRVWEARRGEYQIAIPLKSKKDRDCAVNLDKRGITDQYGKVTKQRNKRVTLRSQTTHTNSYVSTQQTLSRHYQQNLLHRQKGVYTLSERGYERLVYLQENAT